MLKAKTIYIYIYIYIWRPPVAAPDRESEELARPGETTGKLPHLPVVGAGNSYDPGPARRRQEAKRGAQWRRRRPDRGGDRAAAATTIGVF